MQLNDVTTRLAGRLTGRATAGLALAVSLGSLGLVASGGCSSAGRKRSDARGMIAALTAARDAVCACRDLTCAEHAEQRLADFLLLHVDSLKKIPAPRGDEARAAIAADAVRLDSELRICRRRLEAAA